MNVLVTGANGFVGRRLVPELAQRGHQVTALIGPGPHGPAPDAWPSEVATVECDLLADGSMTSVGDAAADWVVHLAAVASGSEARKDPVRAWQVNAVGTVRLLDALERAGRRPRVLVVSTGEVYGATPDGTPIGETVSTNPLSPYAASKLAAEVAAAEACRRSALEVVVARAFAHTGGEQDGRFVVPAFARRIVDARTHGVPVVGVGNLEPVRDFLHVSDVTAAYLALLERGRMGEVYNVASGTGITMLDLFHRIAELAEYRVVPEVDASLVRPVDIGYLVGDASKLTRECDWRPAVTLDETLREVVNAQTN